MNEKIQLTKNIILTLISIIFLLLVRGEYGENNWLRLVFPIISISILYIDNKTDKNNLYEKPKHLYSRN